MFIQPQPAPSVRVLGLDFDRGGLCLLIQGEVQGQISILVLE
jgi:hypothetical protein